MRQRLLKEYIKVKTPDEPVQVAPAAQPVKPAEHKPAATSKAAANELSELFFTANAEERRLILLNLPYAPITPAAPLDPAAAKAVSQRLEAAALNHRIEAFARELEQALSVSRALAHRMVTDPSGEPIVVAASALQMSAAVLQRILLCINPVISQSVQLVYDLALLHEDLKAASALRMIAIWQAAHRPETHPGTESRSATTPQATARTSRHARANSARRNSSRSVGTPSSSAPWKSAAPPTRSFVPRSSGASPPRTARPRARSALDPERSL